MRESRRDGFTLTELMIVIAIMAIVAAIGFSLDGWEDRTMAESQVKKVYADLMNAREQAVTRKRWFYVIFADNPNNNNLYGYNIYTDNDDNGTYEGPPADPRVGPSWNLNGRTRMWIFRNGLLGQPQDFQLDISPEGVLIDDSTGAALAGLPVYMQSPSPPQLNCLSLSATDISLGIWNATNNACNAN